MSTNTRQRRGKTSTGSTVPSGDAALTAEEQIRKAQATILSNKETTERLYAQWRTHLQRISLLVIIMAFHQAQIPMTDCIKDIKAVNAATDGNPVSWIEAVSLVIPESMCEIVGIVLTASLAVFLSLDPPGDFASTSYMLSAALIPLQMGLYYQTRRVGCAGEFDLVIAEEEDRNRQFPVGVVFHTIVTGAYWFMKYGMDQANQNLRKVEELKRQLNDAKGAAANRRKK